MMRKLSIFHCLISKGILVSVHQNVNVLRRISINSICNARTRSQDDLSEELPEIIQISQDRSILYSTYMYKRKVRFDNHTRRKLKEKYEMKVLQERKVEAVPLIIEKLLSQGESTIHECETENRAQREEGSRLNLPYTKVEDVNVDHLKISGEEFSWDGSRSSLREDIAKRMEAYEKGLMETKRILDRDGSEISAERLGSESVPEEIIYNAEEVAMEYGTCDPDIPVSKVPCGGCGAKLHCQDSALPGFVPKELFEGRDRGELRSLICQRCYFLKHHDTALNVRVSPDVCEKLLEPIIKERALVIVVLDLLDVPCSIWPNLIDIIGTRRPVVIVGNKVDLLPADGRNHLENIRESLMTIVDKTPLGRANIKHTALVSAHTGFGIESLITQIQKAWGTKGNIYLVGCTNSGKSTLFNALLGSDMCKTQASDLIRRATTSPWPGTTLNMLKFPVLRPSGYRLYERTQRLLEQQRGNRSYDKTNEYTADVGQATLTGYIGRTFFNEEPSEKTDPFSITASRIPVNSKESVGINESNPDYATGKWCYDTPGTVQPDQMINLLTHEELMKVLPRELIKPRTYGLTSGKTLFIGGLARLDLLYCAVSVRLTVFAAPEIPVTIVRTVNASEFYRNYLGSPMLGVPLGDEERLQHWPVLMPCNLRMVTDDSLESCGDVVLSSAGWITLTALRGHVIEARGWTPGGRGIYLRSPSMLPRIASLKGPRLHKSPAYSAHKLLIPRT